jgi:anti-anti-sigma factor
MFQIQVGPDGNLRLVGRLDPSQTEGARAILQTVSRSVTADCSALEYISSGGISILLETHKRLREEGHTLKLVRMIPHVRRIFSYTRLDRVLEID